MPFKPAERKATKLRMSIAGPAKAGKTLTALRVMRGLVGPEGRIAVIDTEHGSAAKFQGASFAGDLPVEFDADEMSDFGPVAYVEKLHEAEKAGYDGVIIDSLSHAWQGRGGALELVEKQSSKIGGNSFAAWAIVTPQHQDMIEAILKSPAHVIVTMRKKMDYVLEEYSDAQGNKKQRPRKVGLAIVQRDGIEYEFDVNADIDSEHNCMISGSRLSNIDGKSFLKPGADLASEILAWYDGAAPDIPGREIPTPPVSPPANNSHAPALPTREDAEKLVGDAMASVGMTVTECRQRMQATYNKRSRSAMTVQELIQFAGEIQALRPAVEKPATPATGVDY